MQKAWTGDEYVQELLYIMKNFDSFYAYGAFGAPADYKNNRTRYKVPSAPNGSYLFDCSGFAYKAVPWGWNGYHDRVYGGATYKKVPFDALETNDILSLCDDVSEDFETIQVGEVVYMTGHVGIYIGKGEVIECTSAWENGILISCCDNIQVRSDMPYHRTWLKHGKLPFIEYVEDDNSDPAAECEEDVLNKVDWGTANLESAIYNLNEASEHIKAAVSELGNVQKAFTDIDNIISEFFGGSKE